MFIRRMPGKEDQPMRPGDKVNVYNATFSMQFFFEGRATVVGVVDAEQHRARVIFDDDLPFGDDHERYVDPNGQDVDPVDYARELNEAACRGEEVLTNVTVAAGDRRMGFGPGWPGSTRKEGPDEDRGG